MSGDCIKDPALVSKYLQLPTKLDKFDIRFSSTSLDDLISFLMEFIQQEVVSTFGRRNYLRILD